MAAIQTALKTKKRAFPVVMAIRFIVIRLYALGVLQCRFQVVLLDAAVTQRFFVFILLTLQLLLETYFNFICALKVCTLHVSRCNEVLSCCPGETCRSATLCYDLPVRNQVSKRPVRRTRPEIKFNWTRKCTLY